MDPNSHPCYLTFELKIIEARNIYLKNPYQDVFIRCYLPGGNDKRVRLESKTIPLQSTSSLKWDQTFSLNCLGTQETIKLLDQGFIEVELRYKTHMLPCVGRIKKGSKLVGRAKMAWKDIVEPGNAEMEKWFVMIPKNGCGYGDEKPPAVKMAMKVMAMKEDIKGATKRKKELGFDNCGCNSCVDYEFFAIEAALEALI